MDIGTLTKAEVGLEYNMKKQLNSTEIQHSK